MIHKKLWIIAAIGLPIGIGFILLLSHSTSVLGGAAISGYVQDGSYYVMTYAEAYEEVTATGWILNIALIIGTFVILVGSMIALMVATFLDVVRPKSRELFRLGGGRRRRL